MASSQPIPPKRGPGRDFTASLVSSFRATSPIAQDIVARDIAECSEDETVENAFYETTSDSESETGPTLYRQPVGIAFGYRRPSLLPEPAEEPILTRIEKKQSRDAERSLLRDNHLLPPKHATEEDPGFFTRSYKRLFSTKVRKAPQDEEVPGITIEPSETSPLLPGGAPRASADGHEHLSEQWDAAVASGKLQTTWQREAKTIAVYSRSLIVTFLLQYSVNIASIFAVGRIGKVELGAVSLATMTANITCYAPFQGLATSLDTLCAQAYGSGHRHLVGLQVQRMIYFLLSATVPIAILWVFAEDVLILIIPEERSAALAGLYLRITIAGIPGFVALECGKRFVQAQGLFHVMMYVLLIAAPFNILINWLFVWHFGWGFMGAPIAVAVTQNLMPILLFLYVAFIDGSQCWGGFSKRALSNWGPMVKLALPGMIMVEAEWLAFEILTLASSQFGTSYLAAQSILITLTTTTFQIPFPISIAASTRIANLIGAKLVSAAKTSAKVAFYSACLVSIFNVILLSSLRYELPKLLTTDEEVIELVAQIMPLVAVMQIFDSLATMAHGLLRGIGKQHFGGVANLVTYYFIAVPISFGTAFGLDWKLEGLWSGVTLGLFLVAAVEYWYIYRSDWEQSVRDAEHRNAAG
ncbi:MATE efflux family protein [Xylariales sp. AK1849]|nr:MATE efflux family protein [Xylariales sp. AK1849]